ncbi:sugar phosphate nucleotidyltransferase [Paraglaciecola sp.]|uniref:sugar phosphate nucleotidyltransferase n=1 Tax=Paraglaciecola sp. TaxID=1920173 RepID=UPI00273EE886|nr:sugar phosphate nucleotidyltransferase [Paraglaciecola sp.]MDP5030513.1 sugar phosphate nucleotidyltransferase [Paraglaciecola sp.]
MLAGGLGTRLHGVTGDAYPKSLAEIAGRPFLHYIIRYLSHQGIKRFIFAVSHHSQMIIDDVAANFPHLDYTFSLEEQPLGTGGAIKLAMTHVKGNKALVVNSDSFMEFSLVDFMNFAQSKQASLSIVCTEVEDVTRFGAADIDDNAKLKKFFEKGRKGVGFINSGIYLLSKNHILLSQLSGKFSFETEILANEKVPVFAMKNKGLFFDIGTPNDFEGAKKLVEDHGHLFVN